MSFAFLPLKDGDMSSAHVGAFAQRVTRAIVQREIAVAHEEVDFRSMKVVVCPRLYAAVNFPSFPASSCLVLKPKK
jgi:hypothetical protein